MFWQQVGQLFVQFVRYKTKQAGGITVILSFFVVGYDGVEFCYIGSGIVCGVSAFLSSFIFFGYTLLNFIRFCQTQTPYVIKKRMTSNRI